MPINFFNEGGASLHPSGDRFIAGGSDLWVRVFDFKTGEQMECLKVCICMCKYTRQLYEAVCYMEIFEYG